MRFQINKISFRKKYRLTKPDIEAYHKRWPAQYYDTEMFSYAAYTAGICSYCKAELYGLWHIDGLQGMRKDTNPPMSVEEQRILAKEYDAIEEKWADLYHTQADERDALVCATDILCPVCKKGHYTYIGLDFSDEFQGEITDQMVDEMLNPLYESYYTKLGMSLYKDSQVYAEEAAKNFCDSCDIPIVLPGESKILNIQQLKEYVFNLVQLEGNIISLNKRLISLYFEYHKNQLNIIHADYLPQEVLRKKKDDADLAYIESGKKYEKCCQLLESQKAKGFKLVLPPEPMKPVEPEYKKATIFNKRKISLENAMLEKQYKSDIQEYNEKYSAWRSESEALNLTAQEKHRAKIRDLENNVQIAKEEMEGLRAVLESLTPEPPAEVCPEKAMKRMLEAEISKTEDALRNTYKVRNEMYATNIIYGKYRNIVAVATFYEYLISGRCTKLEGHDGAYNLYEAESRANIIISKLADIEKTLNNIEQSQYTIYSKLTDMSKTLNRMSVTMDAACAAISKIEANTNDMVKYMDEISHNTDVIAHNTAVTAYYSKVNAELTNAMGFMVALK